MTGTHLLGGEEKYLTSDYEIALTVPEWCLYGNQ